jgi:hypothetical protein
MTPNMLKNTRLWQKSPAQQSLWEKRKICSRHRSTARGTGQILQESVTLPEKFSSRELHSEAAQSRIFTAA